MGESSIRMGLKVQIVFFKYFETQLVSLFHQLSSFVVLLKSQVKGGITPPKHKTKGSQKRVAAAMARAAVAVRA